LSFVFVFYQFAKYFDFQKDDVLFGGDDLSCLVYVPS